MKKSIALLSSIFILTINAWGASTKLTIVDQVKIPNSKFEYKLNIFATPSSNTLLTDVHVRTFITLGGFPRRAFERVFTGTGELSYQVGTDGDLHINFARTDGTTQRTAIDYELASGKKCLNLKGNYKSGGKYDIRVCASEAAFINGLENGVNPTVADLQMEDLTRFQTGCNYNQLSSHPTLDSLSLLRSIPGPHLFSFTYRPINRHAIDKLELIKIGDKDYLSIKGAFGLYWTQQGLQISPNVKTELIDIEYFKKANWRTYSCYEPGGLSG